MIERLSDDIKEDIRLWYHVKRFPTRAWADTLRKHYCPQGRIWAYCGAWIIQQPDGSYLLRESA